MRISTTQVSSVVLRSKKLEIRKKKSENWKNRRMKTKKSAMKLSQTVYQISFQYVQPLRRKWKETANY
jgi:ERCC4-related helicase